jgi:hypothetical protein
LAGPKMIIKFNELVMGAFPQSMSFSRIKN